MYWIGSMDSKWRQHFYRATLAGEMFGESIAERFGDAVVAGGYLRDRYFDIKPKDLDIFIHVRHMPILSFDEMAIVQQKIKYEALDVVHIIKETWSGVPVEMIFISPPDDVSIMDYVLNKFDIGICKIGYSHEEGVVLHPDFIEDRDNKTVTVVRETIGCNEHLDRVLAKFPGWQSLWRL